MRESGEGKSSKWDQLLIHANDFLLLLLLWSGATSSLADDGDAGERERERERVEENGTTVISGAEVIIRDHGERAKYFDDET